MKNFKYYLIAAALVITNVASYTVGRSNYDAVFEDACHMSDLIRHYEDDLHDDSIIQDYGCFEELEDIYLYDDAVVNKPVELNKYYWCY